MEFTGPATEPVRTHRHIEGASVGATAPAVVHAALTARVEAPVLFLDPACAAARTRALADALGMPLYYAVKANPHPEIVAALAQTGARMDIASVGEMAICAELGVPGAAMSYGNTIKRAADIRMAFEGGVRRFAADCVEEVRKIAAHAPGGEIIVRLAAADTGAGYCLGRKFGCTPDAVIACLEEAARHGLDPAGVCFHIGSQADDPGSWRAALRGAAWCLREARARGLPVRVLDIGGGFPVSYGADALREAAGDTTALTAHARAVRALVDAEMAGLEGLEMMAEPGRALVAPAGAIAGEVVLHAMRAATPDSSERWLYLDLGRFSGLAETEGEFVRYPVITAKDDAPRAPMKVAGPTCDSADVLYARTPRKLPVSLRAGDRVVLATAGAYTLSYASVGFNGFAPLSARVI